MAKGDTNPSLSLDTLFPTLSDESFLQFLKDYYRFLQSTKLTLTDVSGTFVKGEVITGADSKATGVIFSVGTNEIIVVMSTEKPLDSTEIITGSTSGATATVATVKDNVIRESARLKDSRSQYVSGDEFFQLLKDELNRGYPSTSESDRRLLYNRIRDLLQSKSTEEAYRFLFKAFFDENIEIRFPGDDILRVSDGKFEKTSLIRVIPTNTNAFPIGGIFDFLNKTIRGQTSGAVGTVVNISISFLGGIQFAEFNLKLVSGEFIAGETVADVLQPRLSTEVFGVIGDIRIIDGGSGYSVGDQLTITGDGAEATAEVSSISTGPINRILVNTPGYGYRLNTRASVDNTDTAGNNLAIIVSSIANTYTVTDGSNNYIVGDTAEIRIFNRGSGYVKAPQITLIDTTIQALGLLSERLISIDNSGENYSVGDVLTFTGGAGANAAGEVAAVGNTAPYGEDNILIEQEVEIIQNFGDVTLSELSTNQISEFSSSRFTTETVIIQNFVLSQEQEVNGFKSAIKSEDWTNTGPILRIELTNLGSGYTSANLPVLTLESANTVSGANASFTVNNIQGVSANVTVDIANNSVGIGSIRQIDIRNPGINFSNATVDASAIGDGNANLEAIISGLNVNRGFFTNDDGKVNFKIIQDSFFYQDFSYVIRSGLIIDAYQELVKETVHPAGLEFFGEIVITSLIGLQAEFRSQIDQTPRPLALSSFLSLYPVGVNLPYSGSIREVEITPEVIDQVLVGPRTSKFDDKNLSIREIAFERGISVPADFNREIINKLYLFIDVGLFPVFTDVVTGTIPTIPVELDYVLSGISNIVDTHREYQIEIAPIRMEQPLAVRDFNVREIEIVKNIDVAAIVDNVKEDSETFIADQYGEAPISFYAENTISSLSANTFNDFTGDSVIIERFFRRVDTQGLEVDIELVSTDLKAQVVDSTSFGTEQEVPLFVSVPLIRSFVDEIVNRLEILVDVSAQIVFNDVVISETSISDVVLKIESGVTTTLDTGKEYRIQVLPEVIDQAVSVRDFNIRDIEIVKEIGVTTQNYAEYEIDVFTKADTTTYYGDQLLADFATEQLSEYASFNFSDLITIPLAAPGFKSTSYKIDIELPKVVVVATLQPFRISVDRLRLPTLGLGISVIDATISFEGTKYEIDVRPDNIFSTLQVIPQDTGRVKTLRYFVPPLTATINNIYEVIKIQKEVDVAPIPRMKLEIDVPPGFTTPFKEVIKDIQIATLASENISNDDPEQDYSNKTFLDTAYRYQSLSKTDIDYRIEIYQFIDSRMRFYSEILTMTNREMTVEIDVFGEVTTAAITPQEVIINYAITPSAINVANSVRDFNIREIEIQLLIDSRMRFYSEILTMTNREMTVEIDVIAEKVNVAANTVRNVTFNIPTYGEALIQLFASNTIGEFSGTTSDSEEVKADSTTITADEFGIGFSSSANITGTRQIPSSFYEIDIEPVRSQVVSLFIPTVEHLGNTERQIELYIDSRMRFYSEILTMTNREMTTEIDIFSFTNTASIAPQETGINYVIAPAVINVSLVGVTDFNIREIEITPATMDLRMAFYTEIYTMTNRVHTTEIEIQSGTNVIATLGSKFEIDIVPKSRTVIGEEELSLYGDELIRTFASSTFNDSVNRNAVSLNTTLEIVNFIELATVDSRMRFYTEIYTMTNRVHTTEIEIFSKTNTAAIVAQETAINYVIAPVVIDVEMDNFVAHEVAIVLPLDSRMRFYTEILEMTNREMTVEIDVIAESVDVSTTHSKLESISYYQYADVPIVNYASETIASYADNTLNENPGVSFSKEVPLSSYDIEIHSFEDVSPDFNVNTTLFGNEPLATFASEQIQTLATLTFENEYSNLNISKNVFVDGTVTFIDPSYAGFTINRLAAEQIDSYSANAFEDATGEKPSVIGTNTSFTTAFTVGGTLITPTEKFLITSIANNEYLEVNVSPEENYINASIYREYFV